MSRASRIGGLLLWFEGKPRGNQEDNHHLGHCVVTLTDKDQKFGAVALPLLAGILMSCPESKLTIDKTMSGQIIKCHPPETRNPNENKLHCGHRNPPKTYNVAGIGPSRCSPSRMLLSKGLTSLCILDHWGTRRRINLCLARPPPPPPKFGAIH